MKNENDFLRENYHLKDKKSVLNTFLPRIPSEKTLFWWVDRETEVHEWNRILQQCTEVHKNYITFIIGSYGRGKTLSLYKIIDEAKNYPELFPILLNFLGEEKSSGGVDFIFRIFRNIDFNKLVEGKDGHSINKAINDFPEGFDDIQKVLKKIYENEIQSQWFSPSNTTHKSSDQKRSTQSNTALFFLRGEIKPNSSQMKAIGIERKIDNIDTAKKYCAGILIFLKNIGYNSIVISIDEFEYLFSLVPSNQRSIYIALLRGLYDLSAEMRLDPSKIANMVFFIAISEDGWITLKEIERKELLSVGPTVPLLNRVDATITLGAFNKKYTIELISKRLLFNREGTYHDKPLLPFSDDFVDYILEKTQGEPRDIIKYCGMVLDVGLAQRVPKLTKVFAQKVLEQQDF